MTLAYSADSPPRTLTVALAGNPNSGKTTIFNALTGLRQKVANYPGVTVEKKVGKCSLEDGSTVDVVDLPGAYSLVSRSPDEVVAMQVLRGLRADTPAPDVVICVVDASNLQRNLYLVSQLIELGRPMVIALNMMDIAQRRGLHVSAARLSAQLGVPVIPVVGHKKQGVDELKRSLKFATVAPVPDFPLPEAMKQELITVGRTLGEVFEHQAHAHEPRAMFLAERLLVGDHAPDVQPYLTHEAIKDVLDPAHARLHALGIDPMQADIEAHYRWIDDVAAGSLEPACAVLDSVVIADRGAGVLPVSPESEQGSKTDATNAAALEYAHERVNLTDRLDRIFLHKFWGLVTFAAIMATLFIAIFIVADPLMSGTENFIQWLGGRITGLMPEGALRDLWSDGIVAGVGGVLVFVPQIAMLFLFIAILEDTGYLARAAFLMDRVLGRLGLNGKSFIPLLSSFACAIPGIMATRTIENRRDRMATIFVAPFMSCSARLPVYGLLIGAFFASYSAVVRGGIMFACYALGVLAAVGTALVFRKTFMKGAPTSFVLELPTYKAPQIGSILRVMVTNTLMFVKKAGTIIFALSVILWAMAYYPRLSPAARQIIADQNEQTRQALINELKEIEGQGLLTREFSQAPRNFVKGWQQVADDLKNFDDTAEQTLKAAQLENSISGRLGHFIEPVIKPLGYDWKMGVGLIASFAAREVFVAQMGIVYSAGDTEEDAAPLEQAMQEDRYPSGKPVWTAPVAISLLVWFVLAMQCMSTVAIVRRETGTWSWPLAQLLYMNVLAYVGAFIAYHISMHLMG